LSTSVLWHCYDQALVLVRSSVDTIIVPRTSSWFGFYAPNSTDR